MLSDKKTKAAIILRKLVETRLKVDANTTTCAGIYQPKAPTGLEKFKLRNSK